MTTIRKKRKPKHYTENSNYCSKEDFLKRTREVTVSASEMDCQALPAVLPWLKIEAERLYRITSLDDVGVSLTDVSIRQFYPQYSRSASYEFYVTIKIGDMNQEAIDYLWSSQEKENKRLIAYYEKQLAKWQEWHDEFGEAYALQQKQKAEKALKKERAAAERALKAAQAKLDKLVNK